MSAISEVENPLLDHVVTVGSNTLFGQFFRQFSRCR